MGRQWRYTCPKGHYSWRNRSDGYYCIRCDERFSDLIESSLGSTGFYYESESGGWTE